MSGIAGGIYAGSTSEQLYFVLEDVDGQPVLGAVAADFDIAYIRQGAAAVSVSLSDLAGPDAPYSSGGIAEVDDALAPGLYRFDPPNVALAAGAQMVIFSVTHATAGVLRGWFALEAERSAVTDVPTAVQNADAYLGRNLATAAAAIGTVPQRSPLSALRRLVNRNRSAAGTLSVYAENDTTVAWTAALTADPDGEPISEVDPA